MTEDPRCCGSGTCIIDTEGHCWCGQQWNGEKMAAARCASLPATRSATPVPNTAPPVDPDIAAHP